MAKKYIDFNVISENWLKYQLNDGSILKIKSILQKITRTGIGKYDTKISTIQVIYPDQNLVGEPTNVKINPKELQENMEVSDLRVENLDVKHNEYLLDDNTKLKVFITVVNVGRTKFKDKLGEPIYLVQTNYAINMKQPHL